MLNFKSKKTKPLVKQLAEKLGGTWKAERYGFGWCWKCEDGRTVRAYSQLTPGWEGTMKPAARFTSTTGVSRWVRVGSSTGIGNRRFNWRNKHDR